jgi:hypothetical protein
MRTIVVNNPGPQGPVGPQGAPLSYKVYTALLTQSGGDSPDYDNGIYFTVGMTYTIIQKPGTSSYTLGDFTNVGAPNNEIGTSFIATSSDTASNWGTNIDVSWNSGAPIATVLENTIGNIWFTYEQPGYYRINSNGLFTVNKTYPDLKNVFGSQWNKNIWESIEESLLPDVLTMVNYNSADSVFEDGIEKFRIEIRVYN